MISSSSLSAFSTAIGSPQAPHGVQQARAQPAPAPAQALQAGPGHARPGQAGPGGAGPQPGQVLPRGSLLDLSV